MKTTVEPLKFSERIRAQFIEIRSQSGLSLEAFGEKIDAKKSTIHAIESGKNKPSLDLIDRVEEAFGVKL